MSDPGLQLMMQDPYSAMMQQQQRDVGLSSFKSSSYGRASSTIPSASAAASAFYHGMQYANSSFTSGDSFSNMALPTSMAHEYSPMPAHMHKTNNSSLSRPLPSPLSNNHSISPSSQAPPNMNMLDMTSPHPTNTHIESISPPHNDHDRAGTSSTSSSDLSTSKDLSDDSNDKSLDKDDLECVPPKKRALTTPDVQKDETYWDKRKKNNESAKRSREARRMKEEQIALRVVYLEQENLQLRTEVSLLKSEIEKLRCMLYNS